MVHSPKPEAALHRVERPKASTLSKSCRQSGLCSGWLQKQRHVRADKTRSSPKSDRASAYSDRTSLERLVLTAGTQHPKAEVFWCRWIGSEGQLNEPRPGVAWLEFANSHWPLVMCSLVNTIFIFGSSHILTYVFLYHACRVFSTTFNVVCNLNKNIIYKLQTFHSLINNSSYVKGWVEEDRVQTLPWNVPSCHSLLLKLLWSLVIMWAGLFNQLSAVTAMLPWLVGKMSKSKLQL